MELSFTARTLGNAFSCSHSFFISLSLSFEWQLKYVIHLHFKYFNQSHKNHWKRLAFKIPFLSKTFNSNHMSAFWLRVDCYSLFFCPGINSLCSTLVPTAICSPSLHLILFYFIFIFLSHFLSLSLSFCLYTVHATDAVNLINSR